MITKNIFQVLLLLLSVNMILASAPRRINCRKYIYAPICRGVAAKRIVTNINEMLGDDPNVYAKDVPLPESDNIPNIDNSQGQWYMNDQRPYADSFIEFEKKIRKSKSDYDSIDAEQ